MAASRIERFSSIIKRAEGLMKGGVLKKKPIWYDVYRRHPPFAEPTVLRETPDIQINEIFYAEDIELSKKMDLELRNVNVTSRFGNRDERIKEPKEPKESNDVNIFDLNDNEVNTRK